MAEKLSKLGFDPEVRVLYLQESEEESGASIEWLTERDAEQGGVEKTFSVLLGVGLTPQEARLQLEAAEKRGVPATYWQYPGKDLDRPEVDQTKLLARGAEVDVQDDDGATALMFAAASGNTRSTEALIAAHANLNLRDEEGRTALILAVRSNEMDVVRQLVEEGAALDLRDRTGRTAKGQAVARKNARIASYLNEQEAERAAHRQEGRNEGP